MSALGYTHLLRPVTVSGYLPETNAFLAFDSTLGSLSVSIKDGVDRWFRDLKGYANGSYTTYNVWSRLIAIYPVIGGTSTSVAVNARTPGTYNLVHTGSPTITVSGIAYNGTSQYSDTGYTPANSNSTADLVAFGLHRRDSNNDSNASIGIASSGNSYAIVRNDTNRQMYVASNRADASSGSLAVSSLYAGSYSSVSVLNAYRNGVNIKSNTGQVIGNSGNRTFYIGACHGGVSAIYGGQNTIDYVWLANGLWSDNEQAFMNNAFNALQTILGR